MEEEYRKEWNLLKLKFSKQFNVLYVKRHTVLTDASQDSDLTAATAKTGTRNLPNFWLTALKSHILLAEMIMECDVPVLVSDGGGGAVCCCCCSPRCLRPGVHNSLRRI